MTNLSLCPASASPGWRGRLLAATLLAAATALPVLAQPLSSAAEPAAAQMNTNFLMGGMVVGWG